MFLVNIFSVILELHVFHIKCTKSKRKKKMQKYLKTFSFFYVRHHQKKQVHQLSVLISLLLGELTKGDRQKIMTICTIDVHSRDVVLKLIQSKLESASAFQWQSQLRHRWDDDENDCFANICDAQFRYCYEYLGNTPRLVITPLTDRCYITLTQSLHLVMGGGPAGKMF